MNSFNGRVKDAICLVFLGILILGFVDVALKLAGWVMGLWWGF